MITPLVSVITTLYNCESYVKASLESMASQSFGRHWEWLILNDGSTDATWRIVENMTFNIPNCRVVKVPASDNIKIPRRRNQAIAMAKGKYIAIQDGDDISMPDRLALEVGFLENHPEVFCVGGHAVQIDLEDHVIGFMDYPEEKHDRILRQLLVERRNPMIDPTTMFRREVFLRLGRYTTREEIYTVPDMDLWCRAILEGHKMANIRKPLINYRSNPDGMTNRKKSEMIYAHVITWREFSYKYREKFMSRRSEYPYDREQRKSVDQRRT